tara:strand:- start:318 stop:743 length:426 start_codon:yes stop_codon:yes gene_type:complete
MFSIFKKKEANNESDNPSLMAVACLLVHSARIDENYTDKEKKIIRDAIVEMGADKNEIDKIIEEAEEKEKDANQILDFTREVKNINEENKMIIIEALWDIIFSDEDADMYETNLMRRLSGLLYLDAKVVGEIKEKVREKKI